MAVARYFSSVAQPTALAGGISNTNLTMQVQATTGFPTSYPYTLSVDYGTASEELVDVTNASGTTLTITRGVDGTSAQSHGIGAVVRHVSSGRDFADFQTHAAATSGVHGVSGTLVGTSDAQTLANKTLTNPSISGATTSGTWTGNPTISGNWNFTGAPGFRGASTSASALATRVSSGDTTDRLIVSADGTHTWGPGNAIGDVTLGRSGLLVLGTNGLVRSSRINTTDPALSAQIGTDTVERWRAYADGKQEWGPGGSTARDTTLYRNSAGELKTDGALTVAGNLAASNANFGAWTGTWVPTWSTSTGAHTPSYGNAVVAASYVKIGRMFTFSVNITFGNTTTFGASAGTGDNWIFSLPAGITASAAFTGSQMLSGFGRAQQTSAVVPFGVQVDSGGTNLLLNLAGGRQDGVAVANTGTFDSLTPWTWTSGSLIQFVGVMETTT